MSDHFEMLVDSEVGASDAEMTARYVIEALRDGGLIVGDLTDSCVLGELGYRAGPKLPEVYCRSRNECPFWELRTSGVEPIVGRGFNEWALGPVCEGFVCPACLARIQPFASECGDAFTKAIAEWLEQNGPAIAACPRCQMRIHLTEWQCTPPLGFGNLAFRFWNWPPFDLPGWKIDIAELVRDATGHSVISTYGRI